MCVLTLILSVHQRHGLCLVMTPGAWIPSTWNARSYFLGIRWHDRICNTELTECTGLPLHIDLIVIKCNSLYGAWVDTPAHPSTRSTSLSEGFLTIQGNIFWVTQEASGWIRFALTTSHPLFMEICYPLRSFWVDATVLADYVITMTTMNVTDNNTVQDNNERLIRLATSQTDSTLIHKECDAHNCHLKAISRDAHHISNCRCSINYPEKLHTDATIIQYSVLQSNQNKYQSKCALVCRYILHGTILNSMQKFLVCALVYPQSTFITDNILCNAWWHCKNTTARK